MRKLLHLNLHRDGMREDESWLSGADGYLSKPFTAPMLREKIEQVVPISAGDAVSTGALDNRQA
jgi:hypothetical protein